MNKSNKKFKHGEQISVTNSRILIPVKVNNKIVYFLIDTGAQVPLIDITSVEKLNFKLGSKLAGTVVGTGGETSECYHTRNLDVDFHGHKLYQFIATNIDAIKDSIKRDTDYEVVGIISLRQMQQMGLIIDTKHYKVYFDDI